MNVELSIIVADIANDFKNAGHSEGFEVVDYDDHGHSPWTLVRFIDTNTYAKVYKIEELSTDCPTNCLQCEAYPDTSQHVVDQQPIVVQDFLLSGKINKYKFLPNHLFHGERYAAFQWFDDYEQVSIEDFFDSTTQLKSLLKISNDSLSMSVFYKDVVKALKNMYENEVIEDPASDLFHAVKKWSQNVISGDPNNYICYTVSDLSWNDFIVKRDSAGRIVDWKFVDIAGIQIGFPRYLFSLQGDEQRVYGPWGDGDSASESLLLANFPDADTVKTYTDAHGHGPLGDFIEGSNIATEVPGVFYCYNDKWARACDIKDIDSI